MTQSIRNLHVILLGLAMLLAIQTGTALPIQSSWSQQAKLTATDEAASSQFGSAVDLDGNTAIIGAERHDNGTTASGAAYIFTRTGSTWVQQAQLTPDASTSGQSYGWSVAIDGDTAAVGMLGDDDNGDVAGAVFVYTRTAGVWSQQAKLTAGPSITNDRFGYSVDLEGDTLLIGASDDDDNGPLAGAAYFFTRNNGVWTEEVKLLASDGDIVDQFGTSVALDGDWAVIGAPAVDSAAFRTGSAYVFQRVGGVWVEQAELENSNGSQYDYSGSSVDIDDDTIVIGTRGDDDNGPDTGSASVYVRNGNSWTLQEKLTGATAQSALFGNSVALDGDRIVVTAFLDRVNGVFEAGSAYVFERSGTDWSQQTRLIADDYAAGDFFGGTVALDGEYTLVGAPLEGDNGSASGSVYAYSVAATSGATLKFALDQDGQIGAATVDTNDIGSVSATVEVFNLHFDGSAVGLPDGADISAFLLFNENIVLSFDGPTIVPGIADTVEETDLVMYRAQMGDFVLVFDGSDVGLNEGVNGIDAIAGSPDGKLLLSLRQSGSVGGLSFGDSDLLQFNNTNWGANTSGTFATYFDGNSAGLTANSSEDIDGAWIDPSNGEIYFSTIGAYAIGFAAGIENDVVRCVPSTPPAVTTCATANTGLVGDMAGLATYDLDGFDLVFLGMRAATPIQGLE